MKILLIGAGSVGVYFCGRAALGGTQVEVVAHREFDKISHEGYFVESIAGNFTFRPSRVLHSAAEASSDIDAVVLATKVLPDIDREALLSPVADFPSKPSIVLIQNGIGIDEPVAEAFPGNELISVIAYIGASRKAVNHIVHSGAGRLLMGIANDGETSRIADLARCFNAGNVPCEIVPDIALERWKKLLWNLPFNPVSVLGGGLNSQELCDGGEIEALCSTLMDEVIAVANCCSVPLTRAMAEDQFEYTRNFPPYRTSMLQDYEAGRPLEVDAIIGNAVKLADLHGVDVPVMRCCASLLRALDRKRYEK